MSLADIDLDKVTEADLARLKENKIAEGQLIEYKLTTYGPSDADKREALKDVSAFANSSGGHIVIGIDENAGLPVAVAGLSINIGKEIERLENLFRDCIEPRVLGLRLKGVPLANSLSAIVIRIPKSWNPPHRIVHGNVKRFYVRHSTSSPEASMEELRNMFLAAATYRDRARSFRAERISLISENKTPSRLDGDGQLIIHWVPLSALDESSIVDLRELPKRAFFAPMGSGGYNSNYNVDGMVTFRSNAYTQVFRSGAIESVSGGLVHDIKGGSARGFFAHHVEVDVMTAGGNFSIELSKLGIAPPFICMVTLLGVFHAIVFSDFQCRYPGPRLSQPTIHLPDVLVNEFGTKEDVQRALRPIGNAIWNAAGAEASPNFDNDGNWKPQS